MFRNVLRYACIKALLQNWFLELFYNIARRYVFMMENKAKRSHFEGHLKPASNPQYVSAPKRIWTNEEMNRIRLGIIPTSMGQKWFSFMEGSTLFLHRSWTGHGIYELNFQEDKSSPGYIITSAIVTNDNSIYVPNSVVGEERAIEQSIVTAYDL